MPKLMPVTEELAASLDESFAATMFRSTDDFINFYNSGLVNKAAPEVQAFAQEVEATFKNVRLQSKELVFISEAEVHLTEVASKLTVWAALIKLQHEVGKLEADHALDNAELSIENGALLAQAGEARRVLVDRLFKPQEMEALAHADEVEERDGVLYFSKQAVLGLDTTVIGTVHEILV